MLIRKRVREMEMKAQRLLVLPVCLCGTIDHSSIVKGDEMLGRKCAVTFGSVEFEVSLKLKN